MASAEVLQGGHNLESSSAPKRVTPAGGNNDRGSVRYDVGVDEKREHQPVRGGASRCKSV